MKHPQKIRIAQKPHSQATPSAPPPPRPQRWVAAATRLSLPESSPAMPPLRSPQAGEFKPKAASASPAETRPEWHVAGPSSPPGSPLLVAKAEPHRGWDRDARLEAIRRLIQKALAYPQAARRFGWEGTARVRFALGPDGRPTEVTLEFSSHMSILDQEAQAAVRRAAPYPFVEGSIVVPIVFDIRAPRPRIIPGGQ